MEHLRFWESAIRSWVAAGKHKIFLVLSRSILLPPLLLHAFVRNLSINLSGPFLPAFDFCRSSLVFSHADGVGRHFGIFARFSPLSRPQALHFFLPVFVFAAGVAIYPAAFVTLWHLCPNQSPDLFQTRFLVSFLFFSSFLLRGFHPFLQSWYIFCKLRQQCFAAALARCSIATAAWTLWACERLEFLILNAFFCVCLSSNFNPWIVPLGSSSCKGSLCFFDFAFCPFFLGMRGYFFRPTPQ